MNMGKVPEVKEPVKVVKREDVRDAERTRTEYTLLYELIRRNPEKAREFLRRLKGSVVES